MGSYSLHVLKKKSIGDTILVAFGLVLPACKGLAQSKIFFYLILQPNLKKDNSLLEKCA